MFKYQNVSKQEQTITANGNINPRVVKPDATVLSDVPIENPNFKYVGEDSNSVNATVDQPQANAVTNAQPVTNENKEEIK